MKKRMCLLILTLLVLVNVVTAWDGAVWVYGLVNNATDGTNSDNHTVMVSKTDYSENLTEFIGYKSSKCNTNCDNKFLIDCYEFEDNCKYNETLYVQVIDNGDGYISDREEVVILNGINRVPDLNIYKPEPVFRIMEKTCECDNSDAISILESIVETLNRVIELLKSG